MWLFCDYLCNRSTFFWLQILAPLSTAMLAFSLPMKNRKGLIQDVTDMCATLVGLVHDIKDTQHKIAALTAVFYQLSNVDF